MSFWRPVDEKPAVGRRIVVLFNEGFSPELYYVRPDGWLDEEGELYAEEDREPGMMRCWAYIPDDVLFECEVDDNGFALGGRMQ